MNNESKHKNIPIKCKHCESQNYRKKGFRNTENRGRIQKYLCLDCKKYFTNDDGFYRMRNTPQKITQAIDLFFRGVSTRKVQEHLGIFHPHNASNVSIYNWVVKYSKMIGKFTSRLSLNVGSEVQVDEVEYHRRKSSKRRGIETNWFIDSIDPKSKFLISCGYFRTRGCRDVKSVISSIKTKTENQIQVCTTDGMQSYISVIKAVWGWNHHLQRYTVLHNRVVVREGEENFNHPIERLHNTLRQRTKTFRGFHGSVSSANAIMQGFSIYYNFVRKHMTLKKTPSDVAIPDLTFKTGNRWLELINFSIC